MNMIGMKQKRIVFAIRNFYRAFEHRSRWVGEELLLVGDLEKYEDRLFEEWDLKFVRMCDDLAPEALDDEMVEASKRIYEWAEDIREFPIRPGVSEPSITRGSFHMLADKPRIGWHPRYEEILKS